MKRNNRSFALVCAAAVLMALLPPASAAAADKFKDVSRGAWYRDAVSFVAEQGLMSGYSADTFGPDETLTRAMVVQVLYNREKKPKTTGASPFKDVSSGQWYYDAVRWGAAKNVVSGYGGGLFKPEDAVTVEQAAVILHNYSGKPAGKGDTSRLTGRSSWAENALAWAVEKGLFSGMPSFKVTSPATRAQTAQMLMNYLNEKGSAEMIHFTKDGFDKALASGQPMMVDFWADWCGPCKMLAPVIEGLAEDYAGKVVSGKVNVDDEPQLAQQFGVMSIPTVIFFKDGKEVARKVGVQPAAAFTAELDALLK